MAYGYVEPWKGYLDDSAEELDFSKPMAKELPEKFADATKPHEAAVTASQIPRINFHLDPETLEENFGITWKAQDAPGASSPLQEEGETGYAAGSGGVPVFGYDAQSPKPVRLRNFVLRFDDYVKLDSHQDTAESLLSLRKLALPWKDPRAMLHWRLTQTETTELRKHILIRERLDWKRGVSIRMSPPPVREYYTSLVVGRGEHEKVTRGPTTNTGMERVISGILLPPRPVLMVLPGLTDMLCVIEGIKYEITRLDPKGNARAATVTLDLMQYPGGKLEAVVPIGDVFPKNALPDIRKEVTYAFVTLTIQDSSKMTPNPQMRQEVTPLTRSEYANLRR